MKYEITRSESDRMNILKMLLTVFVVIMHANVSTVSVPEGSSMLDGIQWFRLIRYIIMEIIPRFAVQGFFLMSSILLYRKDFVWKDNISKKIKTILVPYVIMNAVWILIYFVCQQIGPLKSMFSNEQYLIADYGLMEWLGAFGIGAREPFLIPLWFLRNLFIYNILAVVIKKIIDRFPKLIFVVITVLYLFTYIDLIYIRNTELWFWCMGYYIVKYNTSISSLDKIKKIPVLCLYILLIGIRGAFNLNGVSLSNPVHICVRALIMATGIVVWFSLFTRNTDGFLQRFLLKISAYSFGVYIFHQMTLGFALKTAFKVLGGNYIVETLVSLIMVVVIIAYCLVLCRLLDRFCPKLYALLTGSRTKTFKLHK